jgi:hypothetical protein
VVPVETSPRESGPGRLTPAARRELDALAARLAADGGDDVWALDAAGALSPDAIERLARDLPSLKTVGARRAVIAALGVEAARGPTTSVVLADAFVRDARVREAASNSLATVATDDQTRTLVGLYLDPTYGPARRHLARALARIGGAESIRALLTALEDDDLALEALTAIQHLRPAGAMIRVRRLCRHPDLAVRARAEATLALLKQERVEQSQQSPLTKRTARGARPAQLPPQAAPPDEAAASPPAPADADPGMWAELRLFLGRSFVTRSRGLASVGTLLLALALVPMWSGHEPAVIPLSVAAALYALAFVLYCAARPTEGGGHRSSGR